MQWESRVFEKNKNGSVIVTMPFGSSDVFDVNLYITVMLNFSTKKAKFQDQWTILDFHQPTTVLC
jgi:hypothetical protein